MTAGGIYGEARVKLTYVLDRLVAATGPTEAVLVSGFWRSGTTWLQEMLAQALAAKTIFEPLDPANALPLHAGAGASRRGDIPMCADELSPADWAGLDHAFRGISPSRSGFAYLCRQSLGETRRRRTIVKFVRAQMLLGEMIARYQPRATIHLSRHPMAVIASLGAADWDWNFGEIDVVLRLGNAALPPELADAVAPLQSLPALAEHQKIAALWALTERAALGTPGVTAVRYEDMVADPEAAMAALLERVGMAAEGAVDVGRDSPVTSEGREGLAAGERLNSWRRQLAPETIRESAEIIAQVWPEAGAAWELS